jgi:hypothetical protein
MGCATAEHSTGIYPDERLRNAAVLPIMRCNKSIMAQSLLMCSLKISNAPNGSAAMATASDNNHNE